MAFHVSDGADAAELRDHVGRTLPGYMVPAAFQRLEAMPLNANEKVDRKALVEQGRKQLAGHRKKTTAPGGGAMAHSSMDQSASDGASTLFTNVVSSSVSRQTFVLSFGSMMASMMQGTSAEISGLRMTLPTSSSALLTSSTFALSSWAAARESTCGAAAAAAAAGSAAYEGVARGVAEDGVLLLETAQGIRRFHSAEVSLRGLV
jgi:hypothetical protein